MTAVPQQTYTHIRWMIRRDMPAILAIEQAQFREHAWQEEDFIEHLRERNVIGMVAERDERIVGYMLYELNRGALHVLNFAVHPEALRTGIGTALVQKLIGKLTAGRRTRITLNVRETNLPAQLFFRAQGFRAIDVIQGMYGDSDEAAYLMRYAVE